MRAAKGLRDRLSARGVFRYWCHTRERLFACPTIATLTFVRTGEPFASRGRCSCGRFPVLDQRRRLSALAIAAVFTTTQIGGLAVFARPADARAPRFDWASKPRPAAL